MLIVVERKRIIGDVCHSRIAGHGNATPIGHEPSVGMTPDKYSNTREHEKNK